MIGDVPAEMFDLGHQHLPLRRASRPEEIGAMVLFLASDDARNLTGVLLPVDGGYVAK